MPQPHIQPRTSHAYGWWWVLALIIIAAGIYWGVSGGHGNRMSAVAGVPGTGTLPIAAIQADPSHYYRQTISGAATVYQVIGPDGFWLEVDNNRLFCVADNQTTVNLPATPPATKNEGGNGITANANNSGNNNQVTTNTGGYGGNGPTRNLYPDEKVMVNGTLYDAAKWKNSPVKNLSVHESDALNDQKVFMYVSSLNSAPLTTPTAGAAAGTTSNYNSTTTPGAASTTVVTPSVTTRTTTRTPISTNNGISGSNPTNPATTQRGDNNGASNSSAASGSTSSTNPNASGAGTAGFSMNNGTAANGANSMNNPNSNNPNSNQGNGTHGARSNASTRY